MMTQSTPLDICKRHVWFYKTVYEIAKKEGATKERLDALRHSIRLFIAKARELAA